MRGIITTIQRMSIHDGPGLRSTVFMKGCNLRCRWCHNPETWSPARQLQHIPSKCIRCYTCLSVCPYGVFRTEKEEVKPDRDRCVLCGKCVENCPGEALSVVGRELSVEEAASELTADRPFYDTTGGGVTLSGGEPLLQPDFCRELLKICRNENIHTAIETNLSVDWQVISSIVSYVDLWMCDLKIHDTGKHKAWTGQGNETIMENFIKLSGTGARMTVRTPVIPGVNDTEEDIRQICDFLSGIHGNITYELLPFHTLGFEKFANLGMRNPMKGTGDLDPAVLERLKKIPAIYGL